MLLEKNKSKIIQSVAKLETTTVVTKLLLTNITVGDKMGFFEIANARMFRKLAHSNE